VNTVQKTVEQGIVQNGTADGIQVHLDDDISTTDTKNTVMVDQIIVSVKEVDDVVAETIESDVFTKDDVVLDDNIVDGIGSSADIVEETIVPEIITKQDVVLDTVVDGIGSSADIVAETVVSEIITKDDVVLDDNLVDGIGSSADIVAETRVSEIITKDDVVLDTVVDGIGSSADIVEETIVPEVITKQDVVLDDNVFNRNISSVTFDDVKAETVESQVVVLENIVNANHSSNDIVEETVVSEIITQDDVVLNDTVVNGNHSSDDIVAETIVSEIITNDDVFLNDTVVNGNHSSDDIVEETIVSEIITQDDVVLDTVVDGIGSSADIVEETVVSEIITNDVVVLDDNVVNGIGASADIVEETIVPEVITKQDVVLDTVVDGIGSSADIVAETIVSEIITKDDVVLDDNLVDGIGSSADIVAETRVSEIITKDDVVLDDNLVDGIGSSADIVAETIVSEIITKDDLVLDDTVVNGHGLFGTAGEQDIIESDLIFVSTCISSMLIQENQKMSQDLDHLQLNVNNDEIEDRNLIGLPNPIDQEITNEILDYPSEESRISSDFVPTNKLETESNIEAANDEPEIGNSNNSEPNRKSEYSLMEPKLSHNYSIDETLNLSEENTINHCNLPIKLEDREKNIYLYPAVDIITNAGDKQVQFVQESVDERVCFQSERKDILFLEKAPEQDKICFEDAVNENIDSDPGIRIRFDRSANIDESEYEPHVGKPLNIVDVKDFSKNEGKDSLPQHEIVQNSTEISSDILNIVKDIDISSKVDNGSIAIIPFGSKGPTERIEPTENSPLIDHVPQNKPENSGQVFTSRIVKFILLLFRSLSRMFHKDK
jgi:hypothetical protein